ncbi:hypothetical protein SCHPADRAFT_985414 [Schizopora paradoxa]|uniref:Zn(2)-C6 fungal-type domain-containing protein n=1 Tax=Schizopora paradoxa TaxID=27342 RepID=A0A0H2RPW5_9AGAM|nr:hypothetical protein SCHPADRAFT_985414 [Schizopora paradoxa]
MPLVQDQSTTNAMAVPCVPITVVTGANSGPSISDSESTGAATRKKNLNKTPCAACRDLHKKCDTSEGFPCNGCKSNGEKARLCWPTTKPPKNKKVKLSVNGQRELRQAIATMKDVVPEPMNAPVLTHHTHFNSNASAATTDEIHLEAPKQWGFHHRQADVQQYLPLFGENEQSASNAHEDITLIRENNYPIFGTPSIQGVQKSYHLPHKAHNTQLNDVAQSEIVHPLGHEAFFGIYDEQAAFLPADQLCQQPFDFSEFSNVSSFPFSS